MIISYIHLPIADWCENDLHLSPEDVTRARDCFNWFVRLHCIKVRKSTDGSGLAAAFQNTIYVPAITNVAEFWVSMHEVGHIVAAPRLSTFEPIWGVVVDEYESDMFAKKMVLKLGFPTELLEQHAKRVLFKHVKRMHKKAKWSELPSRVVDILTTWLGIFEDDWKADELLRQDEALTQK